MLAAAALGTAPAYSADPPPLLSASARETVDLWDVTSGGVRTGAVVLNKLQLSGTFSADTLGMTGFSVHAQVFRTDGRSLSAKVGDVQTADSIDARPVTRLFESWVEEKLGDGERSLAFRAGLIDLNADFDSIQTASLFVNSSQGIGADIARSGRNGPSIYPVSSLGLRVSWLPSKRWTFRVAAFDGVPGDPLHPRALVSVGLRSNDGALLIGQADYHVSDKSKVEFGAWRYSAAMPSVDPSSLRRRHEQGVYASIEGPLPWSDKWSAWLRAGAANRHAQTVDAYAGGGLVAPGLLTGRPEDRLGLAIAHALVSPVASRTFGVHSAETSIEASYQFKVHNTLAVQPDVQYILHPAAVPGARNALVLGVRIVLTAGYPTQAPAAEAADPTVPPDGPQPSDAGQPSPH